MNVIIFHLRNKSKRCLKKKTKKKKTHQKKTILPYNKVPLYILPGIKVCFLYILCKSMYLRSSACIKNHVFDEFIVLNDA